MRSAIILLFLTAFFAETGSLSAHPIPANPKLVISPKVIDFGKVRVGTQVDTFFTVQDTSVLSITLDSTRYQDLIKSSDFTVDSLPGITHTYRLDQNSVAIRVHFRPTTTGFFSISVPIHSLETPTEYVTLQGIGIAPHVISGSHDFGAIRVDSVRQVTLSIQNIGSDTTVLNSIVVTPSFNFNFRIANPLQAPLTLWTRLDTVVTIKIRDSIFFDSLKKKKDTLFFSDTIVTIRDSVRNLNIAYQPRTIGRDSIILQIHTNETTIYDTLWGTGLEPLVLVSPDTIDFGTIVAGISKPAEIDTFITVSNIGTYRASLSVLNNQNNTFSIQTPPSTLDTGTTIKIPVTFLDTVEGAFLDTISLQNDTKYALYGASLEKYQPSIILKGTVLTGSLQILPQVFKDTVRSCDSVRNYLDIYNPYPVTVVIEKVMFDSTGAGLKVPETLIEFPLYIPGHTQFLLPLDYYFPPDSLNGPQVITLHYVRSSVEVKDTETTTVTLFRKRPELSLVAELPSYASSANDVNLLNLPIKIKGPREGVHELDAWTLTLTFSNDLFLPLELDTSGGLVTQHDTIPFYLSYDWDQSSRTYTITTSGAKLSDTLARFNDLLFKLKMRAFLTPDTEVTVTPVLKFVQYPCAYTLHPFTLKIPYANDCGDIILRTFMQSDSIPMRISPISPNPVQSQSPVTMQIDAASNMSLHIITFDGAGREIGRTVRDVSPGMNSLKLNADILPRSGLAEVLIEGYTSNGSLISRRVMKLAIQN